MAITLKTPGKIVSSSVMIKANKLRALKGDMTTGAFTNQVFESLQNLNLGKIITTLANNNSTVRILLIIQKVTQNLQYLIKNLSLKQLKSLLENVFSKIGVNMDETMTEKLSNLGISKEGYEKSWTEENEERY